MDRKIVARFPTLIEAQAAVTCLEAAGLSGAVDNAVVGGMLPHASNALGGFIVSINENELETARQVLSVAAQAEGGTIEEITSPETKLERRFKRAAYAAVLGTIFLPVIANLFSLFQIFSVLRQSPALVIRHKVLLFIALFFNGLGLSIGWLLATHWL